MLVGEHIFTSNLQGSDGETKIFIEIQHRERSNIMYDASGRFAQTVRVPSGI